MVAYSKKVQPSSKKVEKRPKAKNKEQVKSRAEEKAPKILTKVPTPKWSPSTLAELRAAAYNPRMITKKQLLGLADSINRYGDLSGIVFNLRTKSLVSGHQRSKILSSRKAKIVKNTVIDSTGTVAVGYVDVPASKGEKAVRVPYREVNWDENTEMGANIAANAAGGEFDMVKLGKVLKKLEKNKFDIENLPLDSYEFRKALTLHSSSEKMGQETDEKGSFDKVDLGAVARGLQHQCPKCSYRF